MHCDFILIKHLPNPPKYELIEVHAPMLPKRIF